MMKVWFTSRPERRKMKPAGRTGCVSRSITFGQKKITTVIKSITFYHALTGRDYLTVILQ